MEGTINQPSLSVACACMCGRMKPRIERRLPTEFRVELIRVNFHSSVNVRSADIDMKIELLFHIGADAEHILLIKRFKP